MNKYVLGEHYGLLRSKANTLASIANKCCNRTDSYEESLAAKIYAELKKAYRLGVNS